MGGMRQCVKDVLHIAHELEDFDQAKKRIERFFVEFESPPSRATRGGTTGPRSAGRGLQ